MPRIKDIKKVLVIGSGPIVIGQAAEFDYAGTQACRSLKEEGVEVVLLNSNPATIMTDKDIADRVYIEPLTVEVVEQLIKKEKPDSVLPTLGGQAALNLAMELEEAGFLKENNVRLIGTTSETIKKAEDRLEFKKTMEKIGEPCAASLVVENVEDGVQFAESIGYPVVLRPAYTLGGSGGGIAHDRVQLVEILENGVRYLVDVEDGQKTGFFLDQKYNRLAVQNLCKNLRPDRVLDCFTHTGSFALNAGIAGSGHVLGVDASELAVEQARENARLNGLEDRVHFQCADVFDLLPQLEQKGERFDVVILDPPAFTKSRSSIKNAVKGYREINLRGMKLVKDGGYLATCSCSHFMDPELFTKTIREAAANVHKRLRQIEYRTQAADHPILWAADESY